MSNLMDWNLVRARVESIVDLHDYDKPTLGLLHLAIELLLPAHSVDVAENFTEGSRDRGIDCIIVDEAVEPVAVHLFQAKHSAEFKHSTRNFPSGEVDKLLSFVADLLQREKQMKTSCNPILWERVQEIWDLFERGIVPRFNVHLVGNARPLVEDERIRLEQSLRPYRDFTVEEHGLSELASLLVSSKRPREDGVLTLVDRQYFERVDGDIRGLIGTVSATELVRLISTEDHPPRVRREIFDENVRVYLGSKNKINSRILETALAGDNHVFWYLNNGVTMTCDTLSFALMRSPLLNLSDLQIVNGGQTCNALFEAAQHDSKALENVDVLVKIFETRKPTLSHRIAESTNSQTPIRSRDLRSNDEIQRKLEEILLVQGYYYERKAAQHRERAREKRIDALVAAQAYVAYFLEEPVLAVKERGRIFGDMYDVVFDEGRITGDKILAALAVFAPVQARKHKLERAIRRDEPYSEEDLFLIDGAYHLLFAIGHLCVLRGVNREDSAEAITLLAEASSLVSQAVIEEMGRDQAFANKRYFKSARAKRDIQRLAAST